MLFTVFDTFLKKCFITAFYHLQKKYRNQLNEKLLHNHQLLWNSACTYRKRKQRKKKSPCTRKKTQWVFKGSTISLNPPPHENIFCRGRGVIFALLTAKQPPLILMQNDRDMSHCGICMLTLQPPWFKSKSFNGNPQAGRGSHHLPAQSPGGVS